MSEHDYITCKCSACINKRLDKGDWAIRKELVAKIKTLEAEREWYRDQIKGIMNYADDDLTLQESCASILEHFELKRIRKLKEAGDE